MRGIAGLLFGRDAGRLLDLVLDESREEREMAERTRRSGEWCGSTPRRAPDCGPLPGPLPGPLSGPHRVRRAWRI